MLIYTAIYDRYDNILQPQVKDADKHKWICVTDNLKVGGIWQTKIMTCSLSPRRCSRQAKVLYHTLFKEEEIIIWHGGNVRLKGDLMNLVGLLDNADIAAIEHNQRECIYDEAKVCKQWHLDNEAVIDEQMERYRKDGYPEKNGLHAAFLIVRRNTKKSRKFAIKWWQEIKKGSHRDQLSFDYCLWKLGMVCATIPGNIYSGPNYERFPTHKRNQ